MVTNQVDMGPGGAGMMRTQTAGTQAIQRVEPRQIVKVEAAALAEAAMLGDSAFYGWGNGKDRVEGPAWPLTKSLMRIYGNCSLDMEPVQEAPDSWIFTARAVDHETGFSISRQFRQSKRWVVHGKFDESRKEDIRFQIGQSKALRNVALAFLPEWLVDRAFDKARDGVKEKIQAFIKAEGMPAAQAVMMKILAGLGVTEARVLHLMGRKNVESLTLEDLITLRGNATAIERRQETAEELFPDPAAQAAAGAKPSDIFSAKLGGKGDGKPDAAAGGADAPGAAASPEANGAASASKSAKPNGDALFGKK